MNTFTCPDPLKETLVLHNLVSKLENHFRFMAEDRYSKIVNDVPEKLMVGTDERQLLAIMDKVLGTLLNGCYRDNIHISAKCYNSLVLVHMRNDHIINESALTQHFQSVNILAEKLGGCVSISGMKGTTVAITFLNKLKSPF